MIDIKDLQIGNKVLYKCRVVEIATTHITGTVGVLDGHKDFIVPVSCKDIEPIDVTVELLSKSGFKTLKYNGRHCDTHVLEYNIFINDYFISVDTNSNSAERDYFCHIDNISHSTIGGFDFQYLHELQNGIRLITKGDLDANL